MKDNTPTPHIGAKLGEIAETVIMAGDPLRAKFMAEKFLENPVQFNNVRGMLGFTGTHDGKRVSVMGHGMGIASIGIYTYELFNFYDVKTIIRVGSAGSINMDLNVGDLCIAMGACTNSSYAMQYELPGTFAPIADFDLLRGAANAADKFGYRYKVGNVMSSDTFYTENPHNDKWIWACDISYSARAMRWSMTSGASVPRPSSRRRSSSMEGGWMKMLSACSP